MNPISSGCSMRSGAASTFQIPKISRLSFKIYCAIISPLNAIIFYRIALGICLSINGIIHFQRKYLKKYTVTCLQIKNALFDRKQGGAIILKSDCPNSDTQEADFCEAYIPGEEADRQGDEQEAPIILGNDPGEDADIEKYRDIMRYRVSVDIKYKDEDCKQSEDQIGWFFDAKEKEKADQDENR